MATLTDRLDHLLGRKMADALAEAFDIHTVEDLLRHYPQRYATQGAELGESKPPEGAHITMVATVVKAEVVPFKNRNGKMLRTALESDKQRVDATFFNPQKVAHVIKPGVRAMFSGTAKYFREQLQLTHPSYLILPTGDGEPVIGGRVRGSGELAGMARSAQGADAGVDMEIFDRELIPMYRSTRDVETWAIANSLRQVLDQLDDVPDPLPDAVREDLGLIGLDEALRLVHLPETNDDIDRARERLRFDEAAALQLVLAQRRHAVDERVAPACPPRADGLAAAFDAQLPFTLTDGQLAVAEEISADLSRPHPMNRLLQGEVGSGKTVVALRAMLQAIDAGHQCALLAPTEVLAAQHARSVRQMLGGLAMAGELGAAEHATRVTLVTGSMSVPAKRAALNEAMVGDAGIVIGTHALIQEGVTFFNLGMVVVDEQHRFGVKQRDALRARAREGLSPHVLVMTATPIPRTIAMTVLGDLETSTLRELPRGRSPIVSSVVPAGEKPAWVDRAWQRILEEVADGRQAYVVCSRIGDGDEDDEAGGEPALDLDDFFGGDSGPEPTPRKPARKPKQPKGGDAPQTAAAVAVFDELRSGPLATVRTGLLHGRLPSDEKDAVMRDFTAGLIDVLVCTTVVEVGVDVPNATVMVIVDADRFGVSQLHQLRGRVGRGKHQGLCILVTGMKTGSPPFQRLSAVAGTNDGFELAQLDLAQRREGDVLGAAQSGNVKTLRLLSLLDHEDVIASAREFAQQVVAADPDLTEHPGLASMVTAALDADRIEFLEKS
ncbi:ATP-dependent DNA helicase RecG [Rhodococcus spelaei]|uniref:ATP-dependent DNA helicase RecG n=1 Tax=Rhodococcus spelaei TaxID=2546320 RepID=A0A541B4B9_9NOCA|nr:ATP-dependent DNA helicase RecG [Rhodococcus spelaei]TQF67146.1 ATP-dependent DNA helicase RecG [Rhodococcus spelaei]